LLSKKTTYNLKKIIVVVGATGNLGGKIAKYLLAKNVEVRAIVRLQTDTSKINILRDQGVKVFQVDTNDVAAIAKHCEGAACMISALSGLRETIIDVQKIFLDAAVFAKVPKFIPSDYSIDFTNLVPGTNRNLDLRREFHKILDSETIKATTIFNGPFMDLLTTDMPLILFKKQRILCWGNSSQNMEFTSTENIAAFTAEAALDDTTPRYLRIAGDRMSSQDFVSLLTDMSKKQYKLFRPGGIGLLNVFIRLAKIFAPGKTELYPTWQGMQYMRDMMEGRIVFQEYHNDRYANVEWTTIRSYLETDAKELM
jgi:NmrA-like family